MSILDQWNVSIINSLDPVVIKGFHMSNLQRITNTGKCPTALQEEVPRLIQQMAVGHRLSEPFKISWESLNWLRWGQKEKPHYVTSDDFLLPWLTGPQGERATNFRFYFLQWKEKRKIFKQKPNILQWCEVFIIPYLWPVLNVNGTKNWYDTFLSKIKWGKGLSNS